MPLPTLNSPQVENIVCHYPKPAQHYFLALRSLIFAIAEEASPVLIVEETLKWNEPSYLCKQGSTIRLAWKKSAKHNFYIYFNCKSLLIPTIKELYQQQFKYEANRALVFNLDKPLPIKALTHCFSMALNYHNIKHLPLLGA